MLSTLLALTLLAADPLPRPQDLTPALRLHLDEVALAGEGETIPQEAVNLTGNLTAFLINQFTLTAQQEADLASKAHRELIAQNRVLPTPEPVQKVWQQLIRRPAARAQAGRVHLPTYHPGQGGTRLPDPRRRPSLPHARDPGAAP